MGKKQRKKNNNDMKSLMQVSHRSEEEIKAEKHAANNLLTHWFIYDKSQQVKSKSQGEKGEEEKNLGSTSGVKECNVGLDEGKAGSEQNGSTHGTDDAELGETTKEGDLCSDFPPLPSSITRVVIGGNKNGGGQSLGTADSISVSAQVSPGLQTSWLGGRREQISFANMVKGGPSQGPVLHHPSNASGTSASGKSESSSNPPCHNHSEQPMTDNSQTLNMTASSNANDPSEHPSLNDTAAAVSLCRNSKLDAAQGPQVDVAGDVSDEIESASTSTEHTIMSRTGLVSHSSYNLQNTDCQSSCEHREDVPSTASGSQRLSIRDSKSELNSQSPGVNYSVRCASHLRALADECPPPLNFGVFDHRSIFPPLHNPESYQTDSSLALSPARDAIVDTSLLFPLQNHGRSQSHSSLALSPASVAVVDTSLPRPFYNLGRFQSNPTHGHILSRYSNQILSSQHDDVRNLRDSTQQVMTHPQDFMAQSSTSLEQLADTRRYRSLHQNQPYTTTMYPSNPYYPSIQQAPEQALLGSNAYRYNQSSASMNYNPPQNRNEFLVSGLPPDGSLHPLFHDHIPSSNLNHILPSQHGGARNFRSSIQQHGTFSPRDYGADPSPLLIEGGRRYSLWGQQSQAPPRNTSPGHSEFQRSMTRIVEELERRGDFQDSSSNTSHHFWRRDH